MSGQGMAIIWKRTVTL